MASNRSRVVGMTQQKNHVNRNAFDLSHRHMFTSQIGELLPIFTQWCNPNETFKLGYNAMTRTASLNTAAFTRLRENVQYYFVPFQCLWKYFEQTVNNMELGQSGQDIAMVAKDASSSLALSTKLPFVNYTDLVTKFISYFYNVAVDAFNQYIYSLSGSDDVAKLNSSSASGFLDYCEKSALYSGVVFRNAQYRYVAIAKLLNALGYGNFSIIQQYDVYAMASSYVRANKYWSKTSFLKDASYGLILNSSLTSAPNLSVLPLLAYHKVVNDFYRLRNWQSYESWTSNIDYVTPSSDMNASSWFGTSFSSDSTLFDLEFSNLSIDYLTGVLPRAQYGDESAVTVNSSSATLPVTTSQPLITDTNGSFITSTGGSTPSVSQNVTLSGHYLSAGDVSNKLIVDTAHTHNVALGSLSQSFRISALRNAIALQKYKEIQNSNDWSFEEQVLAHFGIKPHCDIHKSRFIGGSDSTININPQINQNLSGDSEPEIKAIGTGSLSAGVKFTADTYGIIIGIYRCTPQLDYAHVGIDRNLLKTDATDFPIPELDSIGMQTQYRFELSAPLLASNSLLSSYDSPNGSVDMSRSYGYATRYAELKTSFDRFDGGFMGAYRSWVTGLDDDFLSRWRHFSGSSSLPQYKGIDELFICRPQLLYSIFSNQWSGTCNDDKLLVGSVNTCIAIRPFSVHGLPWSN
jgi:hypothetical protein